MLPPTPLLDAARARWAQIGAERPEVLPALPLHQALDRPADRAARRPSTGRRAGAWPLPRSSPAPRRDPARGDAGVQVQRAVRCRWPSRSAWLGRFTDVLAAGGAGAAATKAGAAFAGRRRRSRSRCSTRRGRAQPGPRMRTWRRAPGLTPAGRLARRRAGVGPVRASRCQDALPVGAPSDLREAHRRAGTAATAPPAAPWPALAEYVRGERLNRVRVLRQRVAAREPRAASTAARRATTSARSSPDREQPGSPPRALPRLRRLPQDDRRRPADRRSRCSRSRTSSHRISTAPRSTMGSGGSRSLTRNAERGMRN